MLNGNVDHRSASERNRSAIVRSLLPALVLVLLILRHDYWWWDDKGPLLFGFLPVGLWWQALVTLLAAGMMWLLVRFAWPGHLEEEALAAEGKRTGNEEE